MENEAQNPAKKKTSPFLKTLSALSVLLLVLFIAVVLFPAPILRYIFSRIEAQSGINITFDKAYFYVADGSFLYIEGLAVKRQNHHTGNFDLRADNVAMPAMMLNDFRSPVFLITGLRGTYERVGSEPAEEKKHENGKEETVSKSTYRYKTALDNGEINFIDRTPERPFQAVIRIEHFAAVSMMAFKTRSLFEPYVCAGAGQVDSAKVAVDLDDAGKYKIECTEVPLGLLAPYAPVLDDIFVSGNMNILIDELSDETQRRLRVSITLQPDCEIKPANEILAPAIQAALQQLDQSSLPELRNLKAKIERLKTSSESLRSELDKVTQIMDTLKVLAPRDVQEKYADFKSRYDRATAACDEWNSKFETLVQELDRVKVGIVEDTFQYFIRMGVPIEVDVQEVDGEWQYDWYDTVVRLIERNYRTIIAAEYQKRIQEMSEALDRLLVP